MVSRVCLLKLLELLVKGRPSRRKELKESEGMRGEREKIDKKLARKKERERQREKKRRWAYPPSSSVVPCAYVSTSFVPELRLFSWPSFSRFVHP